MCFRRHQRGKQTYIAKLTSDHIGNDFCDILLRINLFNGNIMYL